MILADSASQYIVPATSVIPGIQCSACKLFITTTEADDEDDFLADGLVLTTSIEIGDETYLSHAHVSCIQDLVNQVPSIYTEFEELRSQYLEVA